MKATYRKYTEITREILDSISAGDRIKVNDWKMPLTVMGVSDNYFVMSRCVFGETLYSVCEKIPYPARGYNSMVGGMFHVGTDNWSLGCPVGYDFSDADVVKKYLAAFERAKSIGEEWSEDNYHAELSVRTSVPIRELYIRTRRVLND